MADHVGMRNPRKRTWGMAVKDKRKPKKEPAEAARDHERKWEKMFSKTGDKTKNAGEGVRRRTQRRQYIPGTMVTYIENPRRNFTS